MEKKLTGAELIAQERQRQIEVEGFDLDRDASQYEGGQLAGAAACYISNALNKKWGENNSRFEVLDRFEFMGDRDEKWRDGWPWDKQYDKREKHDSMRSLVIAGALIAAEIDRLQSKTP